MVFHVEYERTVPARKPDGHAPAAPRYALGWNKPVSAIISDYFALQGEELNWSQERAFFDRARESFDHPFGPDSSEIMRAKDERGMTNAVVVAYWTDPVKHARWAAGSPLVAWLKEDARLTDTTGTWRETISVPYDRHETIYSENWYRIGIGQTDGSVIVSSAANGYFGAARDRIPLAAIDRLESPHGERAPQSKPVAGRGQRLLVTAPVNMVTLRSGQYWAIADAEQLGDYIENMRPRLLTGTDYLGEHKQETGTLSLLVLANLDDDGTERRESCVVAHFLSLAHLEAWSAAHKTHLDIYRHAIAMNRKYKEQRQFVSWHELFVLQTATFEYVNCHPDTGLLPYFESVVCI
ncbi:phenylacetaldoxime dehydratase family protein [Paroceanicella profunda]|uniref:Phenylacetaldoxime dehydratase family protein n=1 Tax=Paroceanicella profunda TaxID=2579971 RepID=A0A5B8G3H2_9RHOB|nr:phenylacetaldoxime dehydratase family protein [Paroceanicella profunda]QDL93313.1 phenylacetaldoxime dehydratase family protein [Paroceanicella profunda]